jgi:hypothetical protein
LLDFSVLRVLYRPGSLKRGHMRSRWRRRITTRFSAALSMSGQSTERARSFVFISSSSFSAEQLVIEWMVPAGSRGKSTLRSVDSTTPRWSDPMSTCFWNLVDSHQQWSMGVLLVTPSVLVLTRVGKVSNCLRSCYLSSEIKSRVALDSPVSSKLMLKSPQR